MASQDDHAQPAPAIRPGPDRRRDNRRPMQTKATLTVLDGPLANSVHEILTRDVSTDSVSFLLRDALNVGQSCRIVLMGNGHPAESWNCEVIRTRPLSSGKHEMAVKFRGRL